MSAEEPRRKKLPSMPRRSRRIDATGTELSSDGAKIDGSASRTLKRAFSSTIWRGTKRRCSKNTDEGEVLDLGRVEGLSGAPSTLRRMTESGSKAAKSGRI